MYMIGLIEKRSSFAVPQQPKISTFNGPSFGSLQGTINEIVGYDRLALEPRIKEIRRSFVEKLERALRNRPNGSLIFGVTGETASGKTTFFNSIKKISLELGLPISFLSTDNYFKDISEDIKKTGSFDRLVQNGFETDCPRNFQLDLLRRDLLQLSQGNDIYSPEYIIDGRGISRPSSIYVPANKIIIVEGICTAYEDVPSYFDSFGYVEADERTRLEKFLERCAERNQSREEGLKHFAYTNDAAKEYILPARKFADLILEGQGDPQAVDALLYKAISIILGR